MKTTLKVGTTEAYGLSERHCGCATIGLANPDPWNLAIFDE
jgi:hypothetical protein